jgi:hypothetical protein
MILRYELKSPLALHQIRARLDKQVTTFNVFAYPKESTALFVGIVRENGFKINLIDKMSKIRKSPCTIYGKFAPKVNGTDVKMIITLSPSGWTALIATVLYFGFWLIGNPKQDEVVGGLIMFLMLLCGCCYGFYIGAKKSKKLLQEYLELENPEPAN